MLKTCALYSGSSGNSIFISSKEKAENFYVGGSSCKVSGGACLLVDIGVNGKAIEIAMKEIDESPSEIDGILVTHEHVDHVRGVGVIMRRYNIPLFVNEATWRKMLSAGIGSIDPKLVNIIKSGDSFSIKDLQIQSFATPHDAVESVGFRIIADNKSISVFTDIGEINNQIIDSVSGSDIIFIESNYDYDMLWGGEYPWHLKKRINGAKGHLSNNDCAKTIGHLLSKGTSRFILSHLSKENNSPEIALKTTIDFLLDAGATIDKDFILQVAKRSSISVPWVL